MTGNTTRLSDELLRRALIELAEGPDGSELLTEVLRSVDSTAQVGRRRWEALGWGRAGLLAAVVLLIAGAIGAAVALSSPPPAPLPTPSAPAVLPDAISVSDFVAPFTYSLPPGETTKLAMWVPTSPAVIYWRTSDFALSAKMFVFLVTGYVHACGTTPTPDPSGVTSAGSVTLDKEPLAFLQGLRDIVGVGMGPISPSTLGNLPAMSAEIDPSRGTCSNASLHEDGLGLGGQHYEPSLRNLGTLIVGQTGDTTLGVLISATSDYDLEAWLPVAQAYVDTFIFDTTRGQ